MYCSKCGDKINDDSKFCPNCGNVTSSNGKTNVRIKEEEPNTDEVNGKGLELPKSLLTCGALKIEGKKIVFVNEIGENIVNVSKKSKGILQPLSLEFEAVMDNGLFETFMISKHTGSSTDTGYDNSNEIIGNALFKWNLMTRIKTVIKLTDKNGDEFSLVEKVGLIKGIFKFILPRYSIYSFLNVRTGKMEIKKGQTVIGIIDSIHGRAVNTYIIKDCAALRKKVDLRLVLLGMAIKCHSIT
jgi:hypothetical protein